MAPLSLTRTPSPVEAQDESSESEESTDYESMDDEDSGSDEDDGDESSEEDSEDSEEDSEEESEEGSEDDDDEEEDEEMIMTSRAADFEVKVNDIPKTEAEAQRHIATIRKARGLGNSKKSAEMAQMLESALVVLSEQLYRKSTHFLQELVQNMDDNSYEVNVPTMNITYKNRTLRIDCNEIGFGKANVEAICKIGKSSKRGVGNGTTHIGEKGIGFKSVFKVADVVYIHSGHYSFKLDKNTKLGMIAPIWEKFPGQPIPKFTSLILQLSPKFEVEKIFQELRALDPKFLMFLKNLKEVNIQIHDDVYGHNIENLLYPEVWRTTLSRQEAEKGSGDRSLVNLHRDGLVDSYIVFRHEFSRLPVDDRRVGCTQSTIQLAFPSSTSGGSSRISEKVYAFLPIRDHGFKFMLQADFLLTANREDIDSSDWNKALLDQIPAALLNAVHVFNNSELRYSWLCYLPIRPYIDDFFREFPHKAIKHLSEQPILESIDGNFMAPTDLTYVPEQFTNVDGKPLIPQNGKSTVRYLCSKYEAQYETELKHLGLAFLTAKMFLESLNSFISTSPATFQGMTNEWHSRLAKVLNSLIVENDVHKTVIANLDLIPLRDGRWISSRVDNLFFPLRDDRPPIPQGIRAFEIDPNAEKDPARRHLFVVLGARDSRLDGICSLIFQRHEEKTFQPASISATDLISHAVFLYKANYIKQWINRELWFRTESGTYRQGFHIYIDAEPGIPYSAGEMLKKDRAKFPFVHADYIAALKIVRAPWNQPEHWRKWLLQNLNVSTVPRLVTPSRGSKEPFVLTDEFRYIIDNNPSSVWLSVIRQYWQHYSRYIVPEDPQKSNLLQETNAWLKSQDDLKDTISEMTVKCLGSVTARLGQTFLPRGALISMSQSAAGTIPAIKNGSPVIKNSPPPDITDSDITDIIPSVLLEVLDPNNVQWDILKHFGVVVELGAGIFIGRLRRLKGTRTTIERSFKEEPLVYLPSENSTDLGSWANLNNTIWSGPDWLKRTTCIEFYYPRHQFLFCEILGLVNADLKCLVSEAQRIVPADSLEYITQVFITTSQFLTLPTSQSSESNLGNLTRCRVFPTQKEATFDDLSSALDSDIWYIADRPHLKESFEAKVPFLAFDKQAIEKIQPLIVKLGLEQRFLSKNAVGITVVEDKGNPHPRYTQSMRDKARFFARLIPATKSDRGTILRRLRGIEVYHSKKVLVKWTVTPRIGSPIQGRTEAGRLKLHTDSQTIRLFIRKEDVEDVLPPLELSEALAQFCGITDADHGLMLSHILMQSDLRAIEVDFHRRGIPDYIPEIEPGDSPISDLKEETTNTMTPSEIQMPQNAEVKSPVKLPRLKEEPKSTKLNQNWVDKHNRKVEAPKSKPKRLHESRISSSNSELPQKTELPRKLPPAFETLRNGLVSFSSRSSSLYNNEESETKFIGELYVSNLLKSHLGEAYDPTKNWTSLLRSNAGHAPYRPSAINSSTFTITDTSGKLTELLRKNGQRCCDTFRKNPVFHIEVNTTEGELHSSFPLDSENVEKARSMTLKRTTDDEQREIYILARVYTVYTNPGIALFLDPWQIHRDGSLSLDSSDYYLARFKEKAVAIFLNDAANEHNSESGMYNYQQLKHPREIRLLEIAPGNSDLPLEGTIRHVSVDSKEAFWALSYCWGVFTPLAPFSFKTAEGRIPITASLHSALKSMRDKGVRTLVWADAICINQQDSLEKSIQIRLLRTIYQSAKRVVAWIGSEENNSHQAIETLKQVQSKSQQSTLSFFTGTWATNNPQTLNEEDWSNINTLLKRAWFRRIWIVQELVLPSNVVIACGRTEMNWDNFFDALDTCQELLNTESTDSKKIQRLIHAGPAYALGQTRRRFHENDRRYNLLELLSVFRHTEATQERDKLFALLGLASDADERAFNPDYDSPLEDIVRRYATCFIRRGQVMDLLYRGGTTKSYPFCSWIPFWTREAFPSTISTWAAARPYYAGRGVPPDATLDYTNPMLLAIKGCTIDSIVSISSTRLHYNNIPSFIESCHEMISYMKDYPTGESHQDLMLKLPIGNARRPHLESADTHLGRMVFDSIRGETVEGDWPVNLREELSSISFDEDVMSFHDKPVHTQEMLLKYWQTAAAFANRIGDGAFCVTKRGYAGMVPSFTRVGDDIVVLNGAKVPFVMRKQAWKHPTEWKLIGECYVHGVMYGEGLGFEGVQDEVFKVA